MGWSPARRAALLGAIVLLEIAARALAPAGAGLGWDGLVRAADLALVGGALLAWGPGGLRWAPGGVRAACLHAGAAAGVLGGFALACWGMPQGVPASPAWWAVFVLAGPLAEELVFRGLLLDLLRERMGRSAAVGVSAALFSVLHGPGVGPEALLPLACGLVCGILATGPGGILAAWAVHAAGNAYLGAMGSS